jgi:hypothetical protein
MSNSRAIVLYSLRARLEVDNIARACARTMGGRHRPPTLRLGCPVRCGGLVGASLLPGARLSSPHAAAYASALTCIERAVILHTRGRYDVLIGDALLARAFRHMGSLPLPVVEDLAAATEDMVDETQRQVAPTVDTMEGSDASRRAWEAALVSCGLSRDAAYTRAVAAQRSPARRIIERSCANDEATADVITELMRG